MEKQDDKYLSVGALAKKMQTTIRTLQYYDQIGILVPSKISDGGRRLYSYQDMIKLHQIQSLKALGFSLDDIKNKIISFKTPNDVIVALNNQALVLEDKIKQLQESLTAINALKEEVILMQTVDFKKYADIIVNLQMNNEYYWLIKYFDDESLEHIRNHFDKESGLRFIKEFDDLCNKVIKLQDNNVDSKDDQVVKLAKEFWEMIMEFTGGDLSLLNKLLEFNQVLGEDKHDLAKKQARVNEYLQTALMIYFQEAKIDPFKEKDNG